MPSPSLSTIAAGSSPESLSLLLLLPRNPSKSELSREVTRFKLLHFHMEAQTGKGKVGGKSKRAAARSNQTIPSIKQSYQYRNIRKKIDSVSSHKKKCPHHLPPTAPTPPLQQQTTPATLRVSSARSSALR
jgi:hypothetical protein